MTQFTYLPGPRWLIIGGALGAGIVLLSYWYAKGRARRPLRIALSFCRWMVMAGVALCLLDPEWVEAIKRQPKSTVAVLLDTSRSMSLKDLPQGRLTAAKTWLQTEFASSAAGTVQVEYYSFNRALQTLPSLNAANPTGDGTGLAAALESLLTVPREDPLSGVVLCSDGIETLHGDPESVARLYRRKGIPIHTLTVGTTNAITDIVVDNVQVKRAVPNQSPTKITVVLRAFGYRDLSVPVQILSGNIPVATQQVKLKDGPQTVELSFTPHQRGFQVYEARIPIQPGEWVTTNNRKMFGLDVIDPTINVIYMEGTPQQAGSPKPEWKYLKDALTSDPNIKVKTLYRQFGSNGQFLNTVDADPETGEQIYPVEHPTKGFPRTLAELLNYDVVLHSDIRTASFSADQLVNMARLVEEYGGGFVMIGGNSAFGKGGYHRTILDQIIPVAMEQESDSQARGVRLHVPLAALNHPIMNIGRTREETESIWNEKFPMLYGCNLVDRAKPGAVMLGEDSVARNRYGPRVLMAVQNIGKGRSMAFTSDTTRTWGRDFETLWGEPIDPNARMTEDNCDSRYYRQFWVNAVHWLAAGRLGRTNNPVTLELAQGYSQPGERVSASVKVRDSQQRTIDNADVSLVAYSAGVSNPPVKAMFDRASQSYSAQITLTTNGTFTVRAVAVLNGNALGDDRQLLVGETIDQEMTELPARPDLMANLSRISDGRALSLLGSGSSSEAPLLQAPPPVTVEYKRTPMWDRWWWLSLLLGLLTVEWAARRLSGMA